MVMESRLRKFGMSCSIYGMVLTFQTIFLLGLTLLYVCPHKPLVITVPQLHPFFLIIGVHIYIMNVCTINLCIKY
jgi:hypothetical protein